TWISGDSAELKPMISYAVFCLKKKMEVVVRETVHNGTVYNGTVLHYLHVDPDLSIHPELALETRAVAIWTQLEQGEITRELEHPSPHHLVIRTYLTDPHSTPKRRELGSVSLRNTDHGVFQIV